MKEGAGASVKEDKTLDHEKILLEVTYKGESCLPCYYMEKAVCQVLPGYAGKVIYRRVDFGKKEGKRRFLELSESLYGAEGVRRFIRVAPVPSLFIEGRLVFDAIPPRHELEAVLEKAIRGHGTD